MAAKEAKFESLMQAYAAWEDEEIRAAEREWHDKVPDSLDRAVHELCAGALPAAPLLLSGSAAVQVCARGGKATSAGLKAVKGAAIGLAAAALVTAGAYTFSPAVRELAAGLFRCETVTEQVRASARSPADYSIPSPGEGYALTDEARGERLYYRWFTAPRRQLLVEIAYRLPEDVTQSENVELVELGGLWGTLSEAVGTELLILRDGEVFILIELFNGSREELMEYAEALTAANEVDSQ